MLELKELYKTFNPGTINAKTALNGLSLTLNDGDFVTVIGGNGAGKSTMLNATAGTFFVDSGKVIIDGSDVTNLPEHKRAAFIGRVFQDPMMGTAANMQIEENLALAARRGKKRTLRWGVTKAEREEYHERLKTLGLGLEDRMTAKVGLLSGGQRQRVAAARALILHPQMILADEPTGALDSKNARSLMEKLSGLNRDEQATILMVTHDSNAASFCKRILFIQDGVIFHELRRGDESQQEFYGRILKVMAQLGGGSANVL